MSSEKATLALDNRISPQETVEVMLESLLQFDVPECLTRSFPFLSGHLSELREYLQRLIKLESTWSVFRSYARHQEPVSSIGEVPSPDFVAQIWPLLVGDKECLSWPQNDWDKASDSFRLQNNRYLSQAIAHLITSHGPAADAIRYSVALDLNKSFKSKSKIFYRSQSSVRRRATCFMAYWLEQYLRLSSLEIFYLRHQAPAASTDGDLAYDQIGRDLALIGVLHCRIWGLSSPYM